jgi:TPP-dependent pyruvate/acetoin dehydrogenase alpha subunit
MKRERRPVFLHLRYYRYLQHVGVNEDFDVGYRSKEEFHKWKKADPVEVMRRKLLSDGASEGAIKAIERAIDKQVKEAVKAAERAPFPKKSELYENVFHGKK